MEEIKKSRGKIGTNAYRTNMSTLKRIAEYDFANIPIEKVKKEQIEDFLEDERDKSNSIIKKDYGMLARIYDYAEENDYIKKNFFRGFNKIEKTQSKIATKQVTPMTFEEERRFKEYLANDTHPYKNLVIIELFTGMRLGECLALNISDVDIASNTIRVTNRFNEPNSRIQLIFNISFASLFSSLSSIRFAISINFIVFSRYSNLF